MLAGRILEAVHVVQVTVVERIEQWLDGGVDLRVVHDPARLVVQQAAHENLNVVGVAVQARAAMIGGDSR